MFLSWYDWQIAEFGIQQSLTHYIDEWLVKQCWSAIPVIILNIFFSMQVGETGKAVGIDHIPELVEESIKHIKKDKLTRTLLESERIMLVSGDGRKGYPSEGPYDAIHVGAAAPNLPEPVSFK